MSTIICKADFEAIVALESELIKSAAPKLVFLPIMMADIARDILGGACPQREESRENLNGIMKATLFTDPFASHAYNRLLDQFQEQLLQLSHSGGPVIFQEDRPEFKEYEPIFSAEALEAQKLGGGTSSPRTKAPDATPKS